MKILVAPLNWGLGHASRCVPLVQRMLDEGNEVILGGDGESLTLLRKHFPKLRYVYLASLNLRFSAGKRQVLAMLSALPKLILWAYKDHIMLRSILREENIDRVISDNRFGLYNKATESIYITHQLHIMLPKGWRWAEQIAARLHARIYTRFNKVWVPDAFFKVILCRQGKPKAIGFIYRNEGVKQYVDEAVCSVDKVEALTGIDFFPSLDDATENRIEASASLSEW